MPLTTSMNTFVSRARGSPKRSPRSPSPTNRMVDNLKVNELLGVNRLGSLMIMTQSQGIHTNISQRKKDNYIQIRHNGVWAGKNACREKGLMYLGLYDNGTTVTLATWGLQEKTRKNESTGLLTEAKEWESRVEDVCDEKWTIINKGKGSGNGGFKGRSIRVDNMTVTDMCNLIKKFM
jgi:hypothetical protein